MDSITKFIELIEDLPKSKIEKAVYDVRELCKSKMTNEELDDLELRVRNYVNEEHKFLKLMMHKSIEEDIVFKMYFKETLTMFAKRTDWNIVYDVSEETLNEQPDTSLLKRIKEHIMLGKFKINAKEIAEIPIKIGYTKLQTKNLPISWFAQNIGYIQCYSDMHPELKINVKDAIILSQCEWLRREIFKRLSGEDYDLDRIDNLMERQKEIIDTVSMYDIARHTKSDMAMIAITNQLAINNGENVQVKVKFEGDDDRPTILYITK